MSTRAVIVAAGSGRRLGLDIPKCLLEFGGKSLLQRHLEGLRTCGIDQVVIATGYRSELIETTATWLTSVADIRLVYNPDYQAGSIVTLWRLRQELQSGDNILLMDADVLFDPGILKQLLRSEHPNCFLLDRDFERGDEPVKLCVRGGVLSEFRKQVRGEFDFCGESVGFFRFSGTAAASLAQSCERYITSRRLDEPYEEAVRDMLLLDPHAFGYEDVTGYAWIEIDFDVDVQRARETVMPAIARIMAKRSA